jgi:two-component sensor histidine kinase
VPFGVVRLRRDLVVEFANAAFARIVGVRSSRELAGRSLQPPALHALASGFVRVASPAAPTAASRGTELQVGGRRVDVDVHCAAFFDPRGAVSEVQITLVDATERRDAEDALRRAVTDRETLLREVHHRVKNNLQLLASMLRLQFAGVENEDARRLVQAAQTRIEAIAHVHESLYRSPNVSSIRAADYFDALVGGVTLLHMRPGISIRATVADVDLEFDQAMRMGLIVTELIGNAMRHAFDGLARGAVHVSLDRGSEGLTLCVSDDGHGLPRGVRADQPSTFGLSLVASLARQLGGNLEVIPMATGTRVRVRFSAEGA